jgi:hypothetical protein
LDQLANRNITTAVALFQPKNTYEYYTIVGELPLRICGGKLLSNLTKRIEIYL